MTKSLTSFTAAAKNNKLYGIAVALEDGGAQFMLVLARNEQDALEVAEGRFEGLEIEVMPAKQLVRSQYRGVAFLTTGQ